MLNEHYLASLTRQQIFDQVIYYKIIFYIIINKPRSHFKKLTIIEELYKEKI